MKIAIVGSASPTAEQAPWQDDSWDIWGLAWRPMPRATALFETHHPSAWPNHGGEGYRKRLAHSQIPVFILHECLDLPNATRYPVDGVKKALCPPGFDAGFFTSSIAYILALAIIQPDIEEIAIYGCDMRGDSEYAYQRPAVEFLVGLALGRGIKVFIPPESSLCKSNFAYGMAAGDSPIPQAIGLTEAVLLARRTRYLEDQNGSRDRMMAEKTRMDVLEGAISETDQLIQYVRHFNRGGVIPE